MKRRFAALVAFVLVLSLSGAGAQAGTSAKFDYHIADAFLEEAVGDQTGARAQADNGDIVTVTGNGTFNRASGKATGGGEFAHTNEDGELLGFGTWTATGVEDFDFYGCGVAGGVSLPPRLCGGLLTLSVHVVGAGGAPQFDGVMVVDCAIGANAPEGAGDTITLDIGVINFDEPFHEDTGLTVYVSRNRR